MNFSQRLEELMKHNGITKFRLSKQLNVSPSTVSNWLNGESRPNIERIRQIAEFFDVSTDYLLTGEETTSIPDQTVENHSLEKLEGLLIDAFRRVSVKDKVAILQHAESLAQNSQIYDILGDMAYRENYTFSEAGKAEGNGLTSDDIRKIKILLAKYDEKLGNEK